MKVNFSWSKHTHKGEFPEEKLADGREKQTQSVKTRRQTLKKWSVTIKHHIQRPHGTDSMSHMVRKENIQRKYKAEKYNETGAAAFFFCYVEHCRLQDDVAAAAPHSLSRLSVTLFLNRKKRSAPQIMPWNNSHEAAAADAVLFLSGKHKNSRNSVSSEEKNWDFFFLLFKCWKTEMGLGCRPRWLWLSDAEARIEGPAGDHQTPSKQWQRLIGRCYTGIFQKAERMSDSARDTQTSRRRRLMWKLEGQWCEHTHTLRLVCVWLLMLRLKVSSRH